MEILLKGPTDAEADFLKLAKQTNGKVTSFDSFEGTDFVTMLVGAKESWPAVLTGVTAAGGASVWLANQVSDLILKWKNKTPQPPVEIHIKSVVVADSKMSAEDIRQRLADAARLMEN